MRAHGEVHGRPSERVDVEGFLLGMLPGPRRLPHPHRARAGIPLSRQPVAVSWLSLHYQGMQAG
eukprot:11159596-Lingulodinium_polyedra.AAC.1